MRKKLFIFIILPLAIVLSVMFLFPAFLFAPPTPSPDFFSGHYYELIDTNLTWAEAKNFAESSTYKPDPDGPTYYGHLATITSPEESNFIANNGNFLVHNTYWLGGSDSDNEGEWNWVTGEEWDYTNWAGGQPDNGGGAQDYLRWWISEGGTWDDESLGEKYNFLIEYEAADKHGQAEKEKPQIWVRNHEFQCWQVWINEANAFEFVFVWEYYNNNHVQILDKDGNIVFYIDLPKGDAHFVADLPDGTYTVQIYHEYGHILQEFVIGKP